MSIADIHRINIQSISLTTQLLIGLSSELGMMHWLQSRTYHSMSQVDRCCLSLRLLVWPQWLLPYSNSQGNRCPSVEPNLFSNVTTLIWLIYVTQTLTYILARD